MSDDEVLKLIDREVVDAVVVKHPVVVKRENGETEENTLFIARRADGSKVLFDWAGERYEQPTLDDFRANNDLLDSDDTITLPDDFPDTPGAGEPGSRKPLRLIRVSGHTEATWGWWLGGGSAIVAAGLVLWLRKRRRHVEDVEDEPT